MEIRLNAEQCTGCGACVEICPTRAMRLNNGIAVLDQAACSQCQACVDACPSGAISAVELPVIVPKPVALQPAREAKIVFAEPVPSSPRPWLSAALVFVGREILPRLADSLIAALDRRLAQAQPAHPQVYTPSRSTELSPARDWGRGYRRRGRHGQARRRGRGQGRDAGRES